MKHKNIKVTSRANAHVRAEAHPATGELLLFIESRLAPTGFCEEVFQVPIKCAPSKPKTRTEYEMFDFNDTMKIIDGEVSVESNLYFKWGESNIVPTSQISGYDLILNRHKLVRKVEKEITWQDEFSDILSIDGCEVNDGFDGGLFINGEVSKETLLKAIYHIASITDKPE